MPSSIRTIELSQNQIRIIQKRNLAECSQLEHLNLSKNQI